MLNSKTSVQIKLKPSLWHLLPTPQLHPPETTPQTCLFLILLDAFPHGMCTPSSWFNSF